MLLHHIYHVYVILAKVIQLSSKVQEMKILFVVNQHPFIHQLNQMQIKETDVKIYYCF